MDRVGIWEHIINTGEWGAEFYNTDSVADIFLKRNIFLAQRDPRSGQTSGVRFDHGVAIEPYACFNKSNFYSLNSLGAFSYMNPGTAKVSAGRYCSLAIGLEVFGDRHPIEWATTSAITYPVLSELLCMETAHNDFNHSGFESSQPPRYPEPYPEIEHDVWIGQNVQLARGITIGTGAVIGANAVVTRNVASYTIVGGNPAQVIRLRFNEKLVERFLASKWWEYSPALFKLCDYKNPDKFLDDFEKLKQDGTLLPFQPEKITFRHILNDLMDRL